MQRLVQFFMKFAWCRLFLSVLTKVAVWTLEGLEPMVKVRVGHLPSVKIGGCAHCGDLYLRRRVMDKRSGLELHLAEEPVNRQLMTMLKRPANDHAVVCFRRPLLLLVI